MSIPARVFFEIFDRKMKELEAIPKLVEYCSAYVRDRMRAGDKYDPLNQAPSECARRLAENLPEQYIAANPNEATAFLELFAQWKTTESQEPMTWDSLGMKYPGSLDHPACAVFDVLAPINYDLKKRLPFYELGHEETPTPIEVWKLSIKCANAAIYSTPDVDGVRQYSKDIVAKLMDSGDKT